MVDGQGEKVAIRFGSHTGHTASVRQQTNLAKVRAVAQAGCNLAVGHDDVDDAFLDEIHLVADCALLDYDISCGTVESFQWEAQESGSRARRFIPRFIPSPYINS